MARPFDEPPYPALTLADFASGGRCRVGVHHGGRMVVIGDPTDSALQRAPGYVVPLPGVVDVLIHGWPGRLVQEEEGRLEIPIPLVVQLLLQAGVAAGIPLRLLACFGAEAPAAGLATGQLLATAWGGPVEAANGLVRITSATMRIDLVEWDVDPMAGGLAPTLTGVGQGAWSRFRP